MIGNTTIRRPSQEILNFDLDFDRFAAPFSVETDTKQLFEGFISIGDALDFAIVRRRQVGGRYTVVDANDENVYTIGV